MMRKTKYIYLCLMALFSIAAFANGFDEFGGGGYGGGYGNSNSGGYGGGFGNSGGGTYNGGTLGTVYIPVTQPGYVVPPPYTPPSYVPIYTGGIVINNGPGGYYYGGSPTGGNGSGTSSQNFTIDLLTKKVDPKEELKCFKTSEGAKLKIYVQQPNENTSDVIGANSVGHAFVGIEQNGIVRQLGFYPTGSSNSALVAVGSSYPSEIRDNNNYLYHVSISNNISPAQLNAIINYIGNYPSTYNVNSYACTDFAIKVGNLGGIPLNSTTVSQLLFSGRSPGQLGQEIRGMSQVNGMQISTTKAMSPQSKGTCN
jgi:hypothetical protein